MLCHIFLHIHKVGGTTVVENLWKPWIGLQDRHLEEDFLPDGDLYGHYYTYRDMHYIANVYSLEYRDVFQAFWNAGRIPQKCRLYSGHLGYGIHKVIGKPCRYATVIRHPIERTLSHFHLVKSIGAFPGDFQNYLDGNGIEVSNYQVKMLTESGFCHHLPRTVSDLEEAIYHLETEFDFCVTEDIDIFVDGMIKKYGLNITNSRKIHNRTEEMTHVKGSPGVRHQKFPVPEELLPRLLELNQLDMQLYRWAKIRSQSQWMAGG